MNNYLQPDTPPESRSRYYYPMSEQLHATLREPLRDVLPDQANYDRHFDQFEYLRGVVHVAQRKYHRPGYAGREGYGPIGRYGPRRGLHPEIERALAEVQSDIANLEDNWVRLFGEAVGRLEEAREAYDSVVSEAPWERF